MFCMAVPMSLSMRAQKGYSTTARKDMYVMYATTLNRIVLFLCRIICRRQKRLRVPLIVIRGLASQVFAGLGTGI